jgi:hypothetical protein
MSALGCMPTWQQMYEHAHDLVQRAEDQATPPHNDGPGQRTLHKEHDSLSNRFLEKKQYPREVLFLLVSMHSVQHRHRALGHV